MEGFFFFFGNEGNFGLEMGFLSWIDFGLRNVLIVK